MKGDKKPAMEQSSRGAGTLKAWNRDGELIAEIKDFRPGIDKVDRVTREAMRRMVILDDRGNEMASWNPWK